VLVGAGSHLLDILEENEFDKVIIRLEPSQLELLILRADINRLPGFLRTFQLKSKFEVLQFQTAEAARYALKEIKDVADICDLDQRKIAPWMPSFSRPLQQAAFELRITLERRKPEKKVSIQFSTEKEAQEFKPQLLDLEIDSSCCLQLLLRNDQKNRDKKSISCHWIGDSALEVSEESLLKALQKKGLNIADVRFFREKEYESSLDAQQEVADRISKVFTESRTCSEGEFSVDLKRAYPKDFYWVAWLRFQSSSVGLRCANYCEVLDKFHM
jgi:hypothetical protein